MFVRVDSYFYTHIETQTKHHKASDESPLIHTYSIENWSLFFINTLRPEYNGYNFTDIHNYIFLKENFGTLTQGRENLSFGGLDFGKTFV